jgi:hypothetical protein
VGVFDADDKESTHHHSVSKGETSEEDVHACEAERLRAELEQARAVAAAAQAAADASRAELLDELTQARKQLEAERAAWEAVVAEEAEEMAGLRQELAAASRQEQVASRALEEAQAKIDALQAGAEVGGGEAQLRLDNEVLCQDKNIGSFEPLESITESSIHLLVSPSISTEHDQSVQVGETFLNEPKLAGVLHQLEPAVTDNVHFAQAATKQLITARAHYILHLQQHESDFVAKSTDILLQTPKRQILHLESQLASMHDDHLRELNFVESRWRDKVERLENQLRQQDDHAIKVLEQESLILDVQQSLRSHEDMLAAAKIEKEECERLWRTKEAELVQLLATANSHAEKYEKAKAADNVSRSSSKFHQILTPVPTLDAVNHQRLHERWEEEEREHQEALESLRRAFQDALKDERESAEALRCQHQDECAKLEDDISELASQVRFCHESFQYIQNVRFAVLSHSRICRFEA